MDLDWSSPRGVLRPVGAIAIGGQKQQFEAVLHTEERGDLHFANTRTSQIRSVRCQGQWMEDGFRIDSIWILADFARRTHEGLLWT